MKMKIKLLSALLSAAMCLSMVSLAGCGGNSGPEPRDVDFEISAERQAEMDKESNTIRVLFPGLIGVRTNGVIRQLQGLSRTRVKR